MTETDKMLEEALPCVIHSLNKWALRCVSISLKGFRFPSGSEPTKEQIDETFAKWQKMEELAKKITNHLAKHAEAEKVAEVRDEALIEEIANTAHIQWAGGRNQFVFNAASWAIREYLKRREGK